MTRYIVERLNPHFGYFYGVRKSLHRERTKYQALEIVETPEFGRVLLLDGVTQVAQKYEFLYHEPMVHPALTAHPDPKDVLIIGAGDGGILREVLRHPVDKAVMAELDGGVVDFCERLMPEINQGAFADPRYRLEVGDGRKFVETTDERFDAVIMDMTDPFGPSVMLYTKQFFERVKATFKDERGLFVMHTESPITRPNTFQQCLATLDSVFKHRRTFYLYIQMYATLWSISVCSDAIDVGDVPLAALRERLQGRRIEGLQVYSPETHHAMLAAPPYIQQIAAGAARVPIITDASPKVLDEIDINSEGDLLLTDAAPGAGDSSMSAKAAEGRRPGEPSSSGRSRAGTGAKTRKAGAAVAKAKLEAAARAKAKGRPKAKGQKKAKAAAQPRKAKTKPAKPKAKARGHR